MGGLGRLPPSSGAQKAFVGGRGRLGKAGLGWGRTWALPFGLRCLSFWFKLK